MFELNLIQQIWISWFQNSYCKPIYLCISSLMIPHQDETWSSYVLTFCEIDKNKLFKLYTKASPVRCVTLTAANLRSILNFAMQASWAKFKKESKCIAVKVTLLTEVALPQSVDSNKLNLFQMRTLLQFNLFETMRANTAATVFHIPYTRHYNPQFVYFLPHISLRFIL